jgi:hypothetical protein
MGFISHANYILTRSLLLTRLNIRFCGCKNLGFGFFLLQTQKAGNQSNPIQANAHRHRLERFGCAMTACSPGAPKA